MTTTIIIVGGFFGTIFLVAILWWLTGNKKSLRRSVMRRPPVFGRMASRDSHYGWHDVTGKSGSGGGYKARAQAIPKRRMNPANLAVRRAMDRKLRREEGSARPVDPGAAIATALDEAPLRRIDYNRPDTLPFRATSTIRLLVGACDDEEVAAGMANIPGEIAHREARLSTSIEAELTGSEKFVDIVPRGARQDAVLPGRVTEIEWQVRPLTTRPIELTLTLTNVIFRSGAEVKVRQQVFCDTFTVSAGLHQRTGEWIERNGAIWGFLALLATIVGATVAFVSSGDDKGRSDHQSETSMPRSKPDTMETRALPAQPTGTHPTENQNETNMQELDP